MNKKSGGFFDLDKSTQCTDPNHNPPMHIVIPQGKGYRHICPNCGEEFILTGNNIMF